MKLNETNESVIEGFVCQSPPHDLAGQSTQDVVVEVSLNGYFDQFSSSGAVTFQYQHLCYGRDTFEHYESYPGAVNDVMDYLMRIHPELKKYDIDGDRRVNETEYQAMRATHDAEPDTVLEQALKKFARETCFDIKAPPAGLKIAADRDAMGVPYDSLNDQTGGVMHSVKRLDNE